MNPLDSWIVSRRLMLAIADYVNQQGGDYRTQLTNISRGFNFTEKDYNGIRKILGKLGSVRETSTTSIQFAARKLLEEL